MKDCQDDSERLWSAEYRKQGIPSSYRKDPTRVVKEFITWLDRQKNCDKKTAADLGCGLGRNSFYLASLGFTVTALDLVKENIEIVRQQAEAAHLPIRAFAQDVSEPWPILLNSLDVAIDIFCYKHITNKKAQKNYRNELWKALKPNGFYFISLASVNDGFYGPLLTASPAPEERLIIDPHAQIPSYLYSIDDLTQEFSDRFKVIEASEQTSQSPMHGKEYTRKVLNCIFAKH